MTAATATPQLEHLPTASLTPYAANSRTHSPAQIAQIAASIKEFGFTNPVLIDAQGGIIAGHGRVMAAVQLGLQTVPCLRLSHLSDTQKRAYIIADNKLAENAGWDTDALAAEMQAIAAADFNLDLTGFSEAELETLIHEGLRTLSADQIRQAETSTDTAPTTEAAFTAELNNPKTPGQLPIVPLYGEHHQAFIILCDNQIDEAWLRQKLQLNRPHQSYKDTKAVTPNILSVAQLKQALTTPDAA